MTIRIRTFYEKFTDSAGALLGRECVVCRVSSAVPVCANCLATLKKPPNSCRICAKPLLTATQHQCCKECIEQPPAYDSVYYVGAYSGWLAELIRAAKFSRRIEAVAALRYIATVAGEDFLPTTGMAILPVPTPKSRLIRRGFNLPAMLATRLSVRYQLPIVPSDRVVLPFFVRKQAKLSRQNRQKNRHFYQTNGQLPTKILIIDDIFTTGATVNELAKKLRGEGVQSVAVWVISRGLPDV